MPRETFENNASQLRIAKDWPVGDAPGVHDQRSRAAIGFGLGAPASEPDKLAREVEILLRRPGELDDVEPFLGVGIARLVVAQRGAEHLEFAFVPAADEVQAKAPFADMVGGDELLGGDQGRDQRRVHGSEHDQPLGLGEQTAGPGHGLERGTLIVGRAAIALPAADRQHEFDACPVGHLREPHAIGPAAGPSLRHHRDRPTGGAVGAEQT